MDGRPTQLSDKVLPPPQRPPLITPSLSPPGSRVFPRIPDRPAPLKRPRLSSTPSSSASARPPPAQPRDLRLESSSRLFAFWDQLAARYNKPLDEDDIVDLRELDFVKDRGVTRAAAKPYDIGSFADADDVDSQGAGDDAETSAGEENAPEDDESADELDLISPPTVEKVVQEKLQYYKNWNVPPADEQDPEDAEAFREFEEAEKRRKELCGDDEEEDGPDDDGFANTGDQVDDGEEALPSETEEHPDIHDEDDEDDEESDNWRHLAPSKPTPQRPKIQYPPRPAVDDSSDDELAEWVIDNTPIPPRRSVAPSEDIIDLTLSRSPSPVPPPRGRSQSRPRIQGEASSLARSQSQPRPRAKSKSQLQVSVRPRSASPQALQLLTPPRSSCSVLEHPVEMTVITVRAETPSPKMPRPRSRYVPKSRSVGKPEKADKHDVPQPNFPVPDLTTSLRKVSTKVSRASMKPEVVIMVPRTGFHRGKTPVRPDSPEVPLSVRLQASRQPRQTGEVGSSKSAKGKGKETAPSTITPEPPPVASSSRQNSLQRQGASDESCSPQPVPPKGRKRRRVPSSSSSDGSPEKSSSSQPSPRKQAHRPSGRRSGYSSDAAPPTSSPVRTDYEDDLPSAPSRRDHHRARSEAPIPALPLYPSVYPPYIQRPDHQRASSVAQSAHPPHPLPPNFPPMTLQQSQTLAMFFHSMASGGLFPHPSASFGPAYHPGPPPLSFYGVPHTPSHRGHPPRQSHSFDMPSSEAGPSRSSIYSTPTHYPHSYPYWFDPGYSNSTLPPSSPIPSSPVNSSPILRPASVPPGQRSQSRGRRVSFKLDAKDRPLPDTPSRRASQSDSIGGDRASDDEDEHERVPNHSRRSQTPAHPGKGKGKGKGKARAAPPSDEGKVGEDGKEDAGRAGPNRGRPPPRARTPGPPARREQSVPRGSATSKKATSAKKK